MTRDSRDPAPTTPRGARECLQVFAASFAALLLIQALGPAPAAPRADALRYLEYAVNLMQHGVFGLDGNGDAPAPGRANTPLYPAFAALILDLAGADPAALRCLFTAAAETPGCLARLAPLVTAQLALAAGGLLAVWLAALTILGTRRAAWIAVVCALLSAQPSEFARLVLTENLSLPLFAWLTVAVAAARDGSPRGLAGGGVVLGLLTLTRPEFLTLTVAASVVLAARALVASPARRRRAWRACLMVLLPALLVIGPWLGRNQYHFGDPGLTATYAGQTLAQRVQYNRMTGPELACALIYWLPDFGDSLARRLLPPSCYQRLDFGRGSYYADAAAHYQRRRAEAGGEDELVARLLREDVIARPVRHLASTAALAWRGLFVAKLWGLVAFLAFCYVILARPAWRQALLLASAPAWFMLLLYAAVSVAIPRYSVCFVPVFSVALAACLTRHSQPSRPPSPRLAGGG